MNKNYALSFALLAIVQATQLNSQRWEEPVTQQTIINWYHDEVDYLLQPGLQSYDKKAIVNQFKDTHKLEVVNALRFDSTAPRKQMHEQVKNITRAVVFDFLIIQVRRTIDTTLQRLSINMAWINYRQLVDDIITAYQDAILKTLNKNQRLTTLYKEMENRIEILIKNQLQPG